VCLSSLLKSRNLSFLICEELDICFSSLLKSWNLSLLTCEELDICLRTSEELDIGAALVWWDEVSVVVEPLRLLEYLEAAGVHAALHGVGLQHLVLVHHV
ncbi:MAG: hypothetical protein ACK559_32330, partial [bacterium]